MLVRRGLGCPRTSMSEPTDPSKPVSPDLTGRVDKYQITGKLGKGAMGQVYKAHDTVLERDVALKVMAAQIADDVELIAAAAI